jgi:hypothetical protein
MAFETTAAVATVSIASQRQQRQRAATTTQAPNCVGI